MNGNACRKAQGERAPFEHSTEWAVQMFARMTAALEARAARPAEAERLAIPEGMSLCRAAWRRPSTCCPMPVCLTGIVSAQEHCLTSDVARARLTGATSVPADRLLADRAEGRFLGCAECDGSWFGVSKGILTIYTSQGEDALITDVPGPVINVLRTVCPEILVVTDK